MQLRVLLKKYFKIYWRTPAYNYTRLFNTLLVALVYGTCYLKQVGGGLAGDKQGRWGGVGWGPGGRKEGREGHATLSRWVEQSGMGWA